MNYIVVTFKKEAFNWNQTFVDISMKYEMYPSFHARKRWKSFSG